MDTCLPAPHPSTHFLCRKMKSRNIIARAAILLLGLLLYCEYLHYFVVLLQCTWPQLHRPTATGVASDPQDLKVMFLADTHLLGFREGHWFDKLRREWQMQRAFQTSMILHRPHVVFVLGDLLDEGKWCGDKEFQYHVQRFNSMFGVPSGTQRHLVVGNHDIGFHYMITPHKRQRFEEAFGSRSVGMLKVKGIVFILLNSMAMEGDKCDMCRETRKALGKVALQLQCAKRAKAGRSEREECRKYRTFQYSKPVLLQHFPLFRPSDANCTTEDAAPPSEKNVQFIPKHDTLSREASSQLFELLEPRLVIDAHIHHGCYRLHDNGVPEWTVASFSWRNKQNPSFLMARISADDHMVHICQMPNETTVIFIYIAGAIAILLSICLPLRSNKGPKTS
ncbi:metallophosphoesterase 1-like [Babylonia areolata]|uniref:metallophosphoesterase 1-like n=1 Tax=Babylonia areolata TaxID=304850 RepID=UPI003FCFD4ED